MTQKVFSMSHKPCNLFTLAILLELLLIMDPVTLGYQVVDSLIPLSSMHWPTDKKILSYIAINKYINMNISNYIYFRHSVDY